MVRVISQETFETAVKEMMSDFEMEKDEAIQDAIQQFEAQGVNLSNIIKDLILSDEKKEPMICQCINGINAALENGIENIPQLIMDLNQLKTECDKDIAHKLMAAKEGAYRPVYDCILNYKENESVAVMALKCMVSLTEGQPDLLENKDIYIFKCLLEQENEEIILETLKWISNCCIRHENNRQSIFKSNILVQLKNILELHKDSKILGELCAVLRHLVLDDDIRVEYGNAHEHARLIASETLHLLTQMLTSFKSNDSFVADLLLTIASLVVRHEFCQKVDEAGGLQFIFDVMVEFHENEKINRQCFKLLKALAGNDDVKRNIIKKGGAHLIYTALNRHKGVTHSASNGLGCIAAIALREVENSKSLTETGLPEVIIQCVNIHQDNLSVIKNASWAIRNMTARCPEHRSAFIDMRAEDVLNKALSKFEKEAGHDIKSALRDLGCNVKLEEQWTGKGGKIHTSENKGEFA